ncbi:hypothetical protein AGABI2DRAFT_194636 [Agaricus bisporus var. bisporus H97]|uniref:hypothetical protein n=1 Tax=Agaricus bisporus var. bisporus (strain H97 / ATCC MYA-4626 / FGSC 10389) TaxID=936046 RepID=UPI00029F581D|nr:hypothetical protein AGABI2DRAFT_194636 [Agaricus bisporus var. bisporus H97]EKV44712.1 hypothetical protein AGABI2DRAFT_194636 [Agaricus bisporus var. bisporus H97]
MVLQVALVTGAARGIGEAIARRLAKDGYDLAINDLPSQTPGLEKLQEEIISMGRRSYICIADVSKENEVKNMIDNTVEALGGLHVMIANAGIGRISPGPLGTLESWDLTMATNARGVFLCYKYAAEVMIKQGQGGRIIGASSVAGKQSLESHTAAYAASKFAIRGLTQAAARELGKYNITVNTYAPGPIDTPMSKTFGLSDAEISAVKEKERKMTVLGRIGTADEVAGVVSFLVSSDASYVTGQTMSVNGGMLLD